MKKVRSKRFKVKVLTNNQKPFVTAFEKHKIYWIFQGFYGKGIQGSHIFILKHFDRFWWF